MTILMRRGFITALGFFACLFVSQIILGNKNNDPNAGDSHDNPEAAAPRFHAVRARFRVGHRTEPENNTERPSGKHQIPSSRDQNTKLQAPEKFQAPKLQGAALDGHHLDRALV